MSSSPNSMMNFLQLPSLNILSHENIWIGGYLVNSVVFLIILTAILSGLLIFFAHKVRKDYHAFLALGPGGTPSTFPGYLRICVLRLFALKDPFTPPRLPENLNPETGFLKTLPKRPFPRPKVVGLAPQRQMTQQGSSKIYSALCAEIKEISLRHPHRLVLGTSCFEKHSTGLFSLSTLEDRKTCNGEVCHSHPSDGSLHLTLHPADVKLIIEKGWGERHPLARESWWWRFRFVPTGFVMIYSPRTMEEVKSVVEIIHAAAWWVSGMELRSGRTPFSTTTHDETGSDQ